MQEYSLPNARQMLEKLRSTTTGLDVKYRLATGEKTRRIYLDSTASTLQLGLVGEVMDKYLPYYANTHTDVHFNAKISTHQYHWAHRMVLDFVQADSNYGCFFVGSGATGGFNRVARTMSEKRPERDVVITSIMEHHSNDLPHRKHFKKVVHVPTEISETGFGRVDMASIENALKEYGDRVNYISITGVSNVTGIVNPIYEIAEMAHQYGTLLMVDAAQMAAHIPIQMTNPDNPARNIDLLCFSGHKIYTPGSPGVVVTRLDLFSENEPAEVGGGMVDDVHIDRYLATCNFPDREEAGTPNITGAIALGSVLYALKMIGMDFIDKEETEIVSYAISRFCEIDDVVVYGQTDTSQCQRTGALSFNIRGLHHSLTAAILNDYFNIAVRNDCFCAHPYVRELVSNDMAENLEFENMSNAEIERLAEMYRGMVRASFGLYNTQEDVDRLILALQQITDNKDSYLTCYSEDESGNFVHNTFKFDSDFCFSAPDVVKHWFRSAD